MHSRQKIFTLDSSIASVPKFCTLGAPWKLTLQVNSVLREIPEGIFCQAITRLQDLAPSVCSLSLLYENTRHQVKQML